MDQQSLEYAVRELTESIHEIKLNTERLVSKLEQVTFFANSSSITTKLYSFTPIS